MSNKNIGPFLAFSPDWFVKHQRGLLFLCNAPLIKYWFRYVLRIHKYDCPIDTKITELAPNHFSYGDKLIFDVKDGKLKRQRTTDFRTHPKFAKRIYFAFKPMWWAFHAWDWLIADRWVPQWSWGFSTLTQYPGSIGADNPVDGYVRGPANATWATIRNATGGDVVSHSSAAVNLATASYLAGTYRITRSFFLFDTSALTAGATISVAVMSLAGNGTAETNDDTSTIDVILTTPAATNDLVVGDFDQVGSTVQGFMNIASWNETTNTYNAITLSVLTGISKTSITQFGCRIGRDTANSAPTGDNEVRCLHSSDSGASPDPKLVVTSTASLIKSFNNLAAASVKSVNGLAKASVKSKNSLA